MYKTILLSLCFSLVYCLGSAQKPEWQFLTGPNGGQIRNFDLDDGQLYALTSTGIYRSIDEGYNWELVPGSNFTSVDKRLLKVEKGLFYAQDANGALVCSTDQSATWKPLLQRPFPINSPQEFLQAYFVKGDTILVGSHFTIYRSTDNGQTWTHTADLPFASFLSIYEFKNELFAAQRSSILRSSDGGDTWETILSPPAGLAAVITTDSTQFAFYGDHSNLLRSTDGFRSWNIVKTDTLAANLSLNAHKLWAGGNGNQLYLFQRDAFSFNCPVVYCFSTDGGDTWQLGNQDEQLKGGESSFDCAIFGNHLVLSATRILHTTDLGNTFTEAQNGMKAAYIRAIFRRKSRVFISENWTKRHLSKDQGQSWPSFPTTSLWNDYCGWNQSIEATKEKIFQVQGDYNSLLYSTDEAESWKVVDIEGPSNWATTDHVLWLTEAPWVSNSFVKRFWRIADGDSSLQPLELPELYSKEPVRSLQGLGDRLCVVMGNDYYIYDESGNLIQKLPESPCITILDWFGNVHFDGHTYYNFCGNHAYILSSGATSWQEIYPQDWTTGTPFYHFQRNFIKTYDGITWVGLSGKGLFYSTDHSGRFYPVEPQMPFPYPTALSIDDEELWVGTAGGGIWTLPTPKTLKGPLERDNFKLFPNPSSGTLNLESSVFLTAETTLSIFDTAGKRIAQQELKPGLSWALNFPNLSKGLYFLQLRTASSVLGLKWVVDH